MTLHETTEFTKKFGVSSAIGLGVIIGLVIVFRVGVAVKDILFPPKIAPANVKFGALPAIQFPQSSVDGTFTYALNTVDGTLPTDIPDRVIVYPMVQPKPDLNSLTTIQNTVLKPLGFTDNAGNPLKEIPRGGSIYEWDEQTAVPTGLQRKLIFDTTTFNFDMKSNYVTTIDALSGKSIKDQAAAIETAQSFLGSINALPNPNDLNFDLTANPDPANDYTVAPQLYSIDATSGKLVKTTNLNDTRVIRVDFYQNPIEYTLRAATDGDLTHNRDFTMKMPIMYSNPPFSNIDLYVSSGPNQAQVMEASYTHQAVDISANANAATDPNALATYPVKTAQQAFDELKSGKGFIAAYSGNNSQIAINKIYLAYYIGKDTQQYLMPIYVFEGSNGFFGYVSAIAEEAPQSQAQ